MNKLVEITNVLYDKFVVGNQKAIVGFVLAAVATFVASQGWTLDTTIGEVVESVVSGVIVGGSVWFKSNK